MRIEPTELILVGTWLTYQATGDAGCLQGVGCKLCSHNERAAAYHDTHPAARPHETADKNRTQPRITERRIRRHCFGRRYECSYSMQTIYCSKGWYSPSPEKFVVPNNFWTKRPFGGPEGSHILPLVTSLLGL